MKPPCAEAETGRLLIFVSGSRTRSAGLADALGREQKTSYARDFAPSRARPGSLRPCDLEGSADGKNERPAPPSSTVLAVAVVTLTGADPGQADCRELIGPPRRTKPPIHRDRSPESFDPRRAERAEMSV